MQDSSSHPELTPWLHQCPASTMAGVVPQGQSLQPLGQLPPQVLSRDAGAAAAWGEEAGEAREGTSQTKAVYCSAPLSAGKGL